jgi:hypothetical protein
LPPEVAARSAISCRPGAIPIPKFNKLRLAVGVHAKRKSRAVGTHKGDKVSFAMSDVFLPGPEDVLPAMVVTDEIEGTVFGFSDSGVLSRAFAVVEVVRKQEIIVPVDKLRVIGANNEE